MRQYLFMQYEVTSAWSTKNMEMYVTLKSLYLYLRASERRRLFDRRDNQYELQFLHYFQGYVLILFESSWEFCSEGFRRLK